MSNYRFPFSNTRTFAEVYHEPIDPVDDSRTDFTYFQWFYDNCGVPDRLLTSTSPDTTYDNYQLDTIYFLLMSRFANDHIKISDEQRFKLEVCSRIMQYAPQWQRLMALQDKMLKLTDDDLKYGHTTIYNHAMHPDTDPTTQTIDELDYIDDQNVTKMKRDGLDAEAIADLPERIRVNSNKKLPNYSQIAKVEIQETPFEKTPKMSIKRFLYK